MTGLLIVVALLAALFALPGGTRRGVDRRLAQLIAFAAVAGALFMAKLGVFGLVLLVIGGTLFSIGWFKEKLTDEGALDDTPSSAAPASARPRAGMDREEALAVLGLAGAPNADEVQSAHRRMIAKAHPDTGGSDYLAAKVNEARDVLLRRG